MAGALLTVEHLTVQFGGLAALRDLSLEAREGEILGVIGPNGSGKTTLFNCVTGLYRATGGSIRFGAPAVKLRQTRSRALDAAGSAVVVRQRFPRRLAPWSPLAAISRCT